MSRPLSPLSGPPLPSPAAFRALALAAPCPRGGRRGDQALAVTLRLLVLLLAGCDTEGGHPVSATSATPEIVLEDASLGFEDPPLGGPTCEANGTVRNKTPDKTLIGIEVTAFNAQGSAIAIARADGFTREDNGRAASGSFGRDPLRPGQSGFFHALLADGQARLLHTCDGIVRIELTGVTFR